MVNKILILLVLVSSYGQGFSQSAPLPTKELIKVLKTPSVLTEVNAIRQVVLLGKPRYTAETEPTVRKVVKDIGLTFLPKAAVEFKSLLNGQSFDEDEISVDGHGSLLILTDDKDELEAAIQSNGRSRDVGDWPLAGQSRTSAAEIAKAISTGLGYHAVVVAQLENTLLLSLISPVPSEGAQAIVIPQSHDKLVNKDKSPKASAMIFVSDPYQGFAQAEILLADPSQPPIKVGSKVLFK